MDVRGWRHRPRGDNTPDAAANQRGKMQLAEAEITGVVKPPAPPVKR